MTQTPEFGDLYGTKFEVNTFPGLEVFFYWMIEPKNWAGIGPDELFSVVLEALDFFQARPEDYAKIQVYFGDEIPVVSRGEGGVIQRTGLTSTVYGEDGIHEKSSVVLNRSLELAYESKGLPVPEGDDFKPEAIDWLIQRSEEKVLFLAVFEAWELIVWAIAEEVNHAVVHAKLGSYEKTRKAEEKYEEWVDAYMAEHYPSDFATEPYTRNLIELTASRQVMRFMEHVAKMLNRPEKAALYRRAYELSLEYRMCVLMHAGYMVESPFIRTRPQSDQRSEGE